MNTRLLRKVADHILEEPKRLEMRRWIVRKEEVSRADYPECGTIGCIAGWTCLLKEGMDAPVGIYFENHVEDRAIEHLGLSDVQADRLFHVSSWPDKFRRRFYELTKGRKARRTADRIEHFIKTKGKE